MITFNVVKEEHGWAIRVGKRLTMPFWSRDAAVREATCLAEAIRRHGECTEVIVEEVGPEVSLMRIGGSSMARRDAAPLDALSGAR